MNKTKTIVLSLFIILVVWSNINAQGVFKSPNFGYLLTYPEGWYLKDKTYMPNIDCKIIDGNGNSFIISVAPSSLTSEEYLKQIEQYSSYDLKKGFMTSNHKKNEILLKERRVLNSRICYYIKMKSLMTTGNTLISELYLYSSGKYEYSINGSYFQEVQSTTGNVVNQMFRSYRF
jgi:hypothetical protein